MAYSTAMFQAVSILLFIHFKTEEGLYDYLSTRSIANMLNIPVPTVVKVLDRLNTAGLIQTKEGAKGGNLLARPITKITMLDVFTSIEQNKPLFKIQHQFNMEYDTFMQTIIDRGTASLQSAENAMKNTLGGILLSNLVEGIT